MRFLTNRAADAAEKETTMATKTKTTVELLEQDEAARAVALVEGSLKRNGLTKAQLRDALESGYGKVLDREHPTVWSPPVTPREKAVQAAARLLLRIAHELNLPVMALQGASAKSVLAELLE